jgi:hypothetical protein
MTAVITIMMVTLKHQILYFYFCSVPLAEKLNNSYLMIIIFWEMTPCGSYKNRRFGGSYRLHLQGARVRAGLLGMKFGVEHYDIAIVG